MFHLSLHSHQLLIMANYALSAELQPAHQQDVKGVLAISNERIASCSRDGSVAIWDTAKPDQVSPNIVDLACTESQFFQLKALLNGHHAYVNSLAHIPDSTRGGMLPSESYRGPLNGRPPRFGREFQHDPPPLALHPRL